MAYLAGASESFKTVAGRPASFGRMNTAAGTNTATEHHSDSGDQRGAGAPRLDLIGMVTRDMAASLAFYRRLGLEIAEGAESEDHVEAVGPGGMRVAWDTEELIASFDPEGVPVSGAGRIGLAFLCDGPEGVDRTYRELTDAGYVGQKEPWDAFWGQRYALVQDPDGNGVSLFAQLP